jgi:hypothetical protein
METISLAIFCTGVTQLAKKLGLQGNILVLVCVAAGAVYTYLSTYQPGLWQTLEGVLLAAGFAGNVALVKEIAQPSAPSQV